MIESNPSLQPLSPIDLIWQQVGGAEVTAHHILHDTDHSPYERIIVTSSKDNRYTTCYDLAYVRQAEIAPGVTNFAPRLVYMQDESLDDLEVFTLEDDRVLHMPMSGELRLQGEVAMDAMRKHLRSMRDLMTDGRRTTRSRLIKPIQAEQHGSA